MQLSNSFKKPNEIKALEFTNLDETVTNAIVNLQIKVWGDNELQQPEAIFWYELYERNAGLLSETLYYTKLETLKSEQIAEDRLG
jgi:hypothetical protein